MKKKHRQEILARHLRKKGFSLNHIASKLKVSKSSASVWVRNIKLTKPQLTFLRHSAHTQEIVKKRVTTRLRNEDARRRKIMDAHKSNFEKLAITKDVLEIIGTTLYWAEGGKSPSNKVFSFSNSDPNMIKVIMCFARKVLKVSEEKFRGHIHLHPHLNPVKAERYWSKVTGIPTSQFQKTSMQHNKRSSNTRDTLPYGTISVDAYSTDLYLRMLAGIEAITEKVTAQYN